MFESIALIIIIFIAVILVYAATRPDTFRIERSITINASADKIFPHINDFYQWEAWSPWEKIDPKIQRSYRGADSGKGAIYEWQGNKDIGKGRMEIIQSTPPANLVIAIHFIQPFAAQNTVEFILESQNNTTIVTQAMYGSNAFISKLMGLFFNMDKMVGKKYEEGLASLKVIAEQ
jgi:hypothetical protein